MRKCFLIFVFFFSLTSSLFALDPFVFTNIRSLGMGSVGMTIPNKESVLYANPAGLAFIQETHWDILSAAVILDAKTIEATKNIQRHFNSLQNRFEKLLALAGLAENNGGSLGIGTQLTTVPLPLVNFVNKNFGYGGFAQGYSEIKISNQPGPQITVEGGYDTAIIFGYGYSLSKELSLGVNLKYLFRLGTYDRTTQTRVYHLSNENLYNGNYNVNGFWGHGPAIDIGGLYSFETAWGKNFAGLVAYNIYGKIYGATTSANKFIDDFFNIGNYTPELSQSYSEKIPATVTLGYSTVFSQPFLKDLLLAAEYPLTRRKAGLTNLRFGLEKEIVKNWPVVRLGYNQGAVCFGASFYLSNNIRLDYAYNLDSANSYFWHAFEIKILGEEISNFKIF